MFGHPVARWRLIRLQCIYNLWSIHAVILSFLDVLQSFYSNFISFFGTNLLTQCPVLVVVFACFLHRRKSISNGVQTPWKLLWIFYGPEDPGWVKEVPEGRPEVGTTHQGAPRGLWPPQWPPTPPLHPINPQIFQKPFGSQRNTIPAVASSRTTRSNLHHRKGFIILIGASAMMRE